MNRRNFMQLVTAVVAALAIDPGQLIWQPNKTIFLPPADGWQKPQPLITAPSGDIQIAVSGMDIAQLRREWRYLLAEGYHVMPIKNQEVLKMLLAAKNHKKMRD